MDELASRFEDTPEFDDFSDQGCTYSHIMSSRS